MGDDAPHHGGRPRRVLGYVRVSGPGQAEHGTSLAEQRAEQTRYCLERGYPAPILFVEVEGGGAEKEEKRSEQRRLTAQVRPGDLVLCTKQDRWSRHTLYFLQSAEEIIARGARFFSLAERFDPSTPEGKFASTIMAAVAEQEHARIRQRTVGTRRSLRATGHHVEGHPPLGYKVVRRKLVVDPRGAEIILKMFALCIAGLSTRQIGATILREYPGTHGMDGAGVGRKLRDRRYLGEINSLGSRGAKPKGEWIKGAHEPITDLVTWNKAHAALDARREGGRKLGVASRNAGFMLRGVLKCAHCHHAMGAQAVSNDSSVKHGGYYYCHLRTERARACAGPIAKYADVDAQAEIELLAQVERLAERLAKPPVERRAARARDYDAERTALLRKRDRVVEAIADGVVSASVAKGKVDALARDLDRLDAERAAADVGAASPPDRSSMLAEVETIRRAWSAMTVAAKREVMVALAERVELASTATARWQRGRWALKITWKGVD